MNYIAVEDIVAVSSTVQLHHYKIQLTIEYFELSGYQTKYLHRGQGKHSCYTRIAIAY